MLSSLIIEYQQIKMAIGFHGLLLLGTINSFSLYQKDKSPSVYWMHTPILILKSLKEVWTN